jgi:hypothetical protein
MTFRKGNYDSHMETYELATIILGMHTVLTHVMLTILKAAFRPCMFLPSI